VARCHALQGLAVRRRNEDHDQRWSQAGLLLQQPQDPIAAPPRQGHTQEEHVRREKTDRNVTSPPFSLYWCSKSSWAHRRSAVGKHPAGIDRLRRSHCLRLLRQGDAGAVRVIWERYYPRLVRLAREKLAATPRATADEEDVALSAMDRFFRAAQQGRYPGLGGSRRTLAFIAKDHQSPRAGPGPP
jgi:hypothetical protein